MPMIGVSEKELERDRGVLRKFVKNNPYPSYNFVANELILKQEKDFDQFSEYGTPNHNWIKEIYENLFDNEIVKRNGKHICERGDTKTLQHNYQTLLLVLNHLLDKQKRMSYDDKILIFLNFKKIVSSVWDGIGEWRD